MMMNKAMTPLQICFTDHNCLHLIIIFNERNVSHAIGKWLIVTMLIMVMIASHDGGVCVYSL